MFESRGILCCHSLAVLGQERVKEIPRKYILDHWSKLVKRRHSAIESSHDPSLSSPQIERFDDVCSRSYNVGQFASKLKKTTDILHHYLDMAMVECQKYVANLPSNASEVNNMHTDGDQNLLYIVVKGSPVSIQDIKTPPYVSSSGHPKNRLGSEKEKMVKKKAKSNKRKSDITEKGVNLIHIKIPRARRANS
ncbi:hypothetical protein PIB30_034221 [Stylosanthes scabra]|uniref:Protein FAR1-RELATED SEQUENCE n=1 Tax=Stylosanthes scabra TaxID=79078 RepID=A0ABU6TCG4_9FABA|nr:hypothetical protein [Stylosanthes scabra]